MPRSVEPDISSAEPSAAQRLSSSKYHQWDSTHFIPMSPIHQYSFKHLKVIPIQHKPPTKPSIHQQKLGKSLNFSHLSPPKPAKQHKQDHPDPSKPTPLSFRSIKSLKPSMALCVPLAATALLNDTTPMRRLGCAAWASPAGGSGSETGPRSWGRLG